MSDGPLSHPTYPSSRSPITPLDRTSKSTGNMQNSSGPSVPFRLPRDGDQVLAMLRTPPPPWNQVGIMRQMCQRGRESLVRRAFEEGVVGVTDQAELRSAAWTQTNATPARSPHCSLPLSTAPIATLCI